jgi:hypothetical protein
VATSAVVSYRGVAYEQSGGFDKVCAARADHVRLFSQMTGRLLGYLNDPEVAGFLTSQRLRDNNAGEARLAPIPEWEELHKVWPEVAETAGEDVAHYLLAASTTEDWERGLERRMPWLGCFGARSDEELQNRQAFANLWTTTNAYVCGGAQNFAPVIQNTPLTAKGGQYSELYGVQAAAYS